MCQLWYHWHVEELFALPKLKMVLYASFANDIPAAMAH